MYSKYSNQWYPRFNNTVNNNNNGYPPPPPPMMPIFYPAHPQPSFNATSTGTTTPQDNNNGQQPPPPPPGSNTSTSLITNVHKDPLMQLPSRASRKPPPPRPGPRYKDTFPCKLYALLEAASSDPVDRLVVSWDENGRSFTIHDTEKCIEDLAQNYFKVKKYSSLVRFYFFDFFLTVHMRNINNC